MAEGNFDDIVSGWWVLDGRAPLVASFLLPHPLGINTVKAMWQCIGGQ